VSGVFLVIYVAKHSNVHIPLLFINEFIQVRNPIFVTFVEGDFAKGQI
jgi:hypothetical protein